MTQDKGKQLGDLKLQQAFEMTHPEEYHAFRRLLQQTAAGSVVAALVGPSGKSIDIASKEAKLLYPDGAVIIDCENLNPHDLLFAVETHADGVKSGIGPLLRAVEDGQPVILEKLNLAMPGTSAALMPALEFLAGCSHRMELPNPFPTTGIMDKYEFSRNDMPDTFRLRLTGISEGTLPLPPSTLARFDIIDIRDPALKAAATAVPPQPTPKK